MLLISSQEFTIGTIADNHIILNNERVTNPRWIELYKANWSPVYKSVRTPCSCWMCQGEIYNRCAYKKETIRLIEEII
jgi:hypothetical protein